MAHSHQSQLLSKAAAALHFCGVVVVFFISSTGNGEAEEALLESDKSLQCQVVASGVFPEINPCARRSICVTRCPCSARWNK